jgi:hypothetical protein
MVSIMGALEYILLGQVGKALGRLGIVPQWIVVIACIIFGPWLVHSGYCGVRDGYFERGAVFTGVTARIFGGVHMLFGLLLIYIGGTGLFVG